MSILIGFIWSAQFIVSVPLSLLTQGIKRTWPIVDYPMYSDPHFEGDKIHRMGVVGIRDNGQEIDLRPEDVGGGYWHFQVFARAATHGNEKIIRDMVHTYESRHNLRLAALRVEDRPLLWKGTQIEGSSTETLRTYTFIAGPHNADVP